MRSIDFDTVDSTQTWAEHNIGNIGSVNSDQWVRVTAKRQTAGIGTYDSRLKRQRSWHGDIGDVHVTFAFGWPESLRHKFDKFAQIATLSVASCIASCGIPADVKWINDVMIRGKKVSGVLPSLPTTNIRFTPQDGAEMEIPVLLGVGINLNPSYDDTIKYVRTSLSEEYETFKVPKEDRMSTEDVIEKLSEIIFSNFQRLKKGEDWALMNDVDARLIWKGLQVMIDTDVEVCLGRFIGLTESGFARLLESNGIERQFAAGHMSLTPT